MLSGNAIEQCIALLVDPAEAEHIRPSQWNGIICAARAESLLGTLAVRLITKNLPQDITAIMSDAREETEHRHRRAMWEARCARQALSSLGIEPILLKGTAFVAAGYDAAEGRNIGDLDILVPREMLDDVEQALLQAEWEWVKADPYDHQYYRRWMHELPPLIHKERDSMIDVHHTILPLTAIPKPQAMAMIADAAVHKGGWQTLSPEDIVCHAAAHCIADGDLAGGLRNLWDIDRLVRQFSASETDYIHKLMVRADLHGLRGAVSRALRLCNRLFMTPVDPLIIGHWRLSDAAFMRRLLARNGWGQRIRPFMRKVFYVRSHMIRMPLRLLVPHLYTKWRKGGAGPQVG